MLMCTQNLVRFCQFVLKILSGNHIFTESRNNGITDSQIHGKTEGQGESSIAPLFQSGAIKSKNLTFYFHTLGVITHIFWYFFQICTFAATLFQSF